MEYYQIYTLWSFHLFIKKLNINGLRNCRVYVQVCLLCPTWFGLLVLADTQPSLQTWPCEALFPCWWIGSHRYLSLSFFNLVGVSSLLISKGSPRVRVFNTHGVSFLKSLLLGKAFILYSLRSHNLSLPFSPLSGLQRSASWLLSVSWLRLRHSLGLGISCLHPWHWEQTDQPTSAKAPWSFSVATRLGLGAFSRREHLSVTSLDVVLLVLSPGVPHRCRLDQLLLTPRLSSFFFISFLPLYSKIWGIFFFFILLHSFFFFTPFWGAHLLCPSQARLVPVRSGCWTPRAMRRVA